MVQKLAPERSGKIVIGLTGGFGVGKSTVAHLFEELGAFVVDSDKLAHEALLKESPVNEKVVDLFKEARTAGGEVDRKKIAEIIFQEPERRKKLEAIIHPYVFERIAEEVGEAEEEIVILEIPLLFETGFEPFCHKTLLVKANPDVVAKRLEEKGFSHKEVLARRKAQMSEEEKLKRADIVIDNSGTFQKTREEVEKIWKKIRTFSKGAA